MLAHLIGSDNFPAVDKSTGNWLGVAKAVPGHLTGPFHMVGFHINLWTIAALVTAAAIEATMEWKKNNKKTELKLLYITYTELNNFLHD